MIAESTATIGQPTPAHNVVDKSGTKVRGMFAEIAPRYDLVNRMLSGGIDVWWRHVTVRRAPPPTSGAITRTLCSGRPITKAVMSKRSTCGFWLATYRV